MARLFKILLIGMSLFFICESTFINTDVTSQAYESDNTGSNPQFYIASFNLGAFDLADSDDLDLIADIISRFEIVALQNIQSDTLWSALGELIEKTNAYGHPYDYLIDSNFMHVAPGLAYVYRMDVVYPVQWYTFTGFLNEGIEHAAFIVRFEHNDGHTDFTLINHQTNSEIALLGADFLPVVFNDVKENFPDELDIIFLGPTDMDCKLDGPDSSFDGIDDENFICLIDYSQRHNQRTISSVAPQIIIAAYSEELYWEEGYILEIAESNAVGDTQAFSLVDQPGFSGLIVVNTTNQTSDGSNTKGFCFFNAASN